MKNEFSFNMEFRHHLVLKEVDDFMSLKYRPVTGDDEMRVDVRRPPGPYCS